MMSPMTLQNIWDSIAEAMKVIDVLLGLTAIALGLAAFVVMLWGVQKFIWRLRESRHIAANWPRARATITAVNARDLRIGDSVITQSHADYAFTDADGREFEGTDVEPVVKHPVVGRTLEVAYDPDDPTTSHPAARMGGRIAGWALIFVVVLVLLAGCAAMLIWIGVDALR